MLTGEKDFMAAWGGISSLQFGLSLFWTEAVRSPRRQLTLGKLNQLLCRAPAKLAKLDHCKADWSTSMSRTVPRNYFASNLIP